MVRISISVSEKMERFVAERVRSGEFRNASEYLCHLARRDQQKLKAEVKLRRMIDESLKSGLSNRSFHEIWAEGVARAKRKKRFAKPSRSKTKPIQKSS